jgi:4'-phosphopantetheinyl transferase
VLNAVVALHAESSPAAAALRAASGELQAEALDLWVLRVADVDRTQLDLSLLDAAERRRAGRLEPEDRLTYVAAHILLRQLLGGRLGVAPREVAYIREPCPWCGAPCGRPALDRPTRSLHFSLSRSGGVVMIGIASAPVGVDVEALPRGTTVDEVTELLHPAERAEILSTAPATRAEVFTRVWTRKEAYLKGVGVGVIHGLGADYPGIEERTAVPVGWTVVNVPVAAGYDAAVAVQSTAAVEM